MKEKIDKRLGKSIYEPTPKCPECGTYTRFSEARNSRELNTIHRWKCPNCHAAYEAAV